MSKAFIFGVGLNKTGTTSIAKALKILGISTRHGAPENAASLKSGCWPDDVDAFLDGPIHVHQFELAEQFPEALFIQTVRPMDDWINSRIVHVLHNRLRNDGDPWLEIDTVAWRQEYEEWEKNAKLFREQNPGRVLYWALDQDANWNSLCRFLKLSVPDEEFPHRNRGHWRLFDILERYR